MIFRCRSIDTGRRPLCGCFVLSCMVGGILRKPLGFRRCLPPARPEKAWPFQAGRSPCTKHPRFSGFAFTNLKKFLRVPRGVFLKTLPWQGVGQCPTERKFKPVRQGAPFQAGRSPFTKRPQTVRLRLYAPKKVFGGSKGRFFKNAPWQSVGQGPTGEKKGIMDLVLTETKKKSIIRVEFQERKRGKTRWPKHLLPTVCGQRTCLKW